MSQKFVKNWDKKLSDFSFHKTLRTHFYTRIKFSTPYVYDSEKIVIACVANGVHRRYECHVYSVSGYVFCVMVRAMR